MDVRNSPLIKRQDGKGAPVQGANGAKPAFLNENAPVHVRLWEWPAMMIIEGPLGAWRWRTKQVI